MTQTAVPPVTPATPISQDDLYLISFLLDRTGSMATCAPETISGFNEFLHQQQRDPSGKAFMSLTLFDSEEIELRFDAVPIAMIPDLGTPANPFEPRANTPLYDAVSTTIAKTERMASAYTRVLLVIQTDGEENASHECTREQVFDLITAKQKSGWAVVFMGADQNAWLQARAMGVVANNTMSYKGTSSPAAFDALSASASMLRYTQGATAASYFGGSGKQTTVDIDLGNAATAGSGPPPVVVPVTVTPVAPVASTSRARPAPKSDSTSSWRNR